MRNERKTAFIMIWLVFLTSLYFIAWTNTYDTATPAGTDDPREADDRMREIKAAIAEVMDVEHDWTLTGTLLTGDGKHTDITCDTITLNSSGYITDVIAKGPQVDVRAYGADDTGASDSTTAIQAAIDACPIWGTVIIPYGDYLLSDELDLPDKIFIEGKGATLIQSTNDKAIFRGQTASNTSYIDISGLIFEATGTGCFAVRGPTSSYYFSVGEIRECYFDASIAYGLYFLPAHWRVIHCYFGRWGTSGSRNQPIHFWGDNTTPNFNNTLDTCWFEEAVDVNAAVQVDTGNSFRATGCTWQNLLDPAIYSRGCWNIDIDNCTFENIDPASGNQVIFDIGQDASSNQVKLTVSHSRFTQGTGDTTALVETATGGVCSFLHCRINASDNYWTQRSGAPYDTRIIELLNNWDNLTSTIGGNAYKSNYPYVKIDTLADDATPTVAGLTICLSGGTTTITDFDDGVKGQMIIFIAEHSLDITDGTNIFLSGSANWSMTATDTLTLIQKADGKWYELSRGDNGA